MAGLLPLIRGATALYPVTRRLIFSTAINMALNATEQRSRLRPPLTELVLPYSMVNATDLGSMRTFFESQKGTFDTSWGMVLGRAPSGSISSASHTLTATSTVWPLGPFLSTDTGKQIVVVGAGTAGANLVTTVSAYTSPTQVSLTDAAGTTVSGADTRWGLYFPNLTLQAPDFPATEREPTRTTYSFQLRARQTQNPAYTTGSTGGSFPAFSNGTITQFPYVRTQRFQVLLNDNQTSGTRYSWTWFDGGLSGFPSGSLRGWQLTGSALTDADLAVWETFFADQWGRYGTFTFTDPEDSTSHTKCRFDSDVFEVQHISPDINTATLKILETN